jgi:hypothetical protein
VKIRKPEATVKEVAFEAKARDGADGAATNSFPELPSPIYKDAASLETSTHCARKQNSGKATISVADAA